MLTLERVESAEVASPVVKAGGSSNGAVFAMCVSVAARGEYSLIPGEDAVMISGLRSAAGMVRLFPFGEGEWNCSVGPLRDPGLLR
jgi:hypothetical protein